MRTLRAWATVLAIGAHAYGQGSASQKPLRFKSKVLLKGADGNLTAVTFETSRLRSVSTTSEDPRGLSTSTSICALTPATAGVIWKITKEGDGSLSRGLTVRDERGRSFEYICDRTVMMINGVSRAEELMVGPADPTVLTIALGGNAATIPVPKDSEAP